MRKPLRDSPGTMDGPRKKKVPVGPGGNPCGEIPLEKSVPCALAPKPAWKDAPDGRSSEMDFGSFRLVVHHHIDYPPERWLLTVHGNVVVDKKMMGTIIKTLDEAKNTAIIRLFCILHSALEKVMDVLPDPQEERKKREAMAASKE